MNKTVREHYPASKLPDDLRGNLDPSSMVTVTVDEEEQPPEHIMSLEEIFALKGFRRRSGAKIDADIRQMRDEWDE
jgi:hypothetical protein